jgi:hypothetical protein
MKTWYRNSLIVLLFCLTFCVTHTASAWYSPGLQRWITRDPVEESGGVNLFSFVVNQPTNLRDAVGLQFAPPSQFPQIPMPGTPWPTDSGSTTAKGTQIGPVNTGNGPVAYPGIPAVRLPPCSNRGEQRITTPPAPTGNLCPCSGFPISCFSYDKCELVPINQGLNGTIMGLRWVPYTRCTICPEY